MARTTETVTLVVGSPPVFTSLPTAAATVGKPMQFVVKTRAYPRSLLTLTSGAHPAGITFTASNGHGPPVTQIVAPTVTARPPRCPSSARHPPRRVTRPSGSQGWAVEDSNL
ncbi:MAG: hypothetical protein KGJ77_09790 [Acidobacteriota bacterium]|nr:hypothetical protein [Acidobacteriota bacterium]